MELIIVLLVAFLVCILYFVIVYNILVKSKFAVKQSRGTIDVYLKQRFDLIPNLVEVVKGYSKHEEGVITELVSLRTRYMESNHEDVTVSSELHNDLSRLIAVVEAYPDLKASEQYLNLQKQLIKIESQLQAARRIYNMEVTDYNTKISVFPKNAVAKMFKFKEEALFSIEENEKQNIKVLV